MTTLLTADADYILTADDLARAIREAGIARGHYLLARRRTQRIFWLLVVLLLPLVVASYIVMLHHASTSTAHSDRPAVVQATER